jgi:hypothetical protein
MWLPDPAAMAVFTLWIALVGAALNFVNVGLGLFAVVTGKDLWPKLMRRLRRRVPASPEDCRLQGAAQMLSGGAIMVMLLGLTMNTLVFQQHAGPAEPGNTLRFLVTLVAFGASLAGIVGGYSLSLRVRYLDTKVAAKQDPGLPAA